jgi:hypothetical protein
LLGEEREKGVGSREMGKLLRQGSKEARGDREKNLKPTINNQPLTNDK